MKRKKEHAMIELNFLHQKRNGRSCDTRIHPIKFHRMIEK